MPIITSYGDGLLTSTAQTAPQPSSSIISTALGPISSLLEAIPFQLTTGGTTISSAALTQVCPSGQVYNTSTGSCQPIVSIPIFSPPIVSTPSYTIPLILLGIGGIIVITLLIKRRSM